MKWNFIGSSKRRVGLVQTGDDVVLDVANRSISLEVSDDELSRPAPGQASLEALAHRRRGWERLDVDRVLRLTTGQIWTSSSAARGRA